jgi:hypothetical protein
VINKKKEPMRSKEFNVDVDSIVEFCEVLDKNDLTNKIVGVNDDEEIVIEVSYDSSERAAIFELMEITESEEI